MLLLCCRCVAYVFMLRLRCAESVLLLFSCVAAIVLFFVVRLYSCCGDCVLCLCLFRFVVVFFFVAPCCCALGFASLWRLLLRFAVVHFASLCCGACRCVLPWCFCSCSNVACLASLWRGAFDFALLWRF